MSERLTKHELAWLLTQEARSAAQKLRQGVGISVADAILPPPTPTITDEGSGGVESTLNRLEAVSMLANLHGGNIPRGRRGRIDLAALLWEIAPEARVQIEMGEGCNVFGDESELRRMLLVLLGQTGDPTATASRPDVAIKRIGDDVRVTVNLGPDKPATYEAERAWLARMAIRYGGRIELDGASETLALPAEIDQNRREVESLKKELAAAQAQGEAYARELATMLRDAPSIPPPHGGSGLPPSGGAPRMPSGFGTPSHQAPSGDSLPVLVAAVRGVGSELRGILSAIGRDIGPLRDREGEAGEIAASVSRHVTAASESIGDLTRIGACPIGELPRHADIADLVRDVVKDDTVRAARHDVRLEVTTPNEAFEVVAVGALTVLVHALVDLAIGSSPPGSQIRIALEERPSAWVLTIDDAGSPLPPEARSSVLSREFETIAHGRPPGIALIAAHTIAAHLRVSLDLEDAPQGGGRTRVTIPRSG